MPGWAAVVVRVLEALELTENSGMLARYFVPWATVLVQVLEARDLTIAPGHLPRYFARCPTGNRARVRT
jgi:hypothetical protein